MSISIVVAISKDNCIGKDGGLPWHIPEDMEHMRKKTEGRVLIMGRRTWESIPEKRRPLPNRKNVVITGQQNYTVPEGVEVYSSVAQAVKAHEGEDIVSFGGTSIFSEMLPIVDTLEITHVETTVDGCTAFFPEIDWREWREVWREEHTGFSFVTYKKAEV